MEIGTDGRVYGGFYRVAEDLKLRCSSVSDGEEGESNRLFTTEDISCLHRRTTTLT
jgi:hypothetical protein